MYLYPHAFAWPVLRQKDDDDGGGGGLFCFVATDAVATATAVCCHHQIIYVRIGIGVGFCQQKNINNN
jgi:hypothetical protein